MDALVVSGLDARPTGTHRPMIHTQKFSAVSEIASLMIELIKRQPSDAGNMRKVIR